MHDHPIPIARLEWGGLGEDDHAVRSLYEEAFPASERTSWPLLVDQVRTGERALGRIRSSTSEDLVGFVITASLDDDRPKTVLIEYLAVDHRRRGQGIGRSALTSILHELHEQGTQLAVLEAESPLDDAANQEQVELRRRRIGFYERCGAIVRPSPAFHEVPDLARPGASVRMALLAFALEDVSIPWSAILRQVLQVSYSVP